MSKFDLVNIETTAGPYQYFVRCVTINSITLIEDMKEFLIRHTGDDGWSYGGQWWYSPATDRIYLRGKDLTFFLLAFGENIIGSD